ncbi:MAG: class I SAM-dependent methyltransferase [Pirellulales bacterium]|nr:class I SAM-dependent methyltransferase [Pirellulales bacterium]
MFDSSQYELLDFGDGRKLERFGGYVIDRPSPAAERTLRHAETRVWPSADARFERTTRDEGEWHVAREADSPWIVEHGDWRLELKRTEFGHVGVFPEQAENWDWLARQVRSAGRPLKVLNLFAYTGASTLAAAAAGASVVHVDAARNTVAWASRNARQSGLAEAPIRWIVEDAARFVRREVRRGNHYDAVILDPPSYGHGPKGEPWKLGEHLLPLLRECAVLLGLQPASASTRQPARIQAGAELAAQVADARAQAEGTSPAFVLLTCHSPGFGPAELGACLSEAFFGSCGPRVEAKRLKLRAGDGRTLDAGVVARWTALA